MIIGPRMCYLSNRDGSNEEAIAISISCESRGSPFPDDPLGYEGFVTLKSDVRDEKFKLYASDEILMVGRLIRLAGGYLLGECSRGHGLLRTDEKPEVTTPYDLF